MHVNPADLDPFWRTRTMRRESLLFIADSPARPPQAPLLYPPAGPVSLTTSDGAVTFVAGRDYVVDADLAVITLTPGSPVPFVTTDQLYPAAPCGDGFMHVRGDASRFMLWAEDDTFHRLQTAVSYAHTGQVRAGAGVASPNLPRTMVRLRAAQPLTLAVTGDSISEGYNASGFLGVAPWQPPYASLVAADLERRYRGSVTLHNLAVAGSTSSDGWGLARDVAATQPHLVLVAFGMNDAGYMEAAEYQANIQAIITTIRHAAPDTEFVLVASMEPHPDWHYTSLGRFAAYRDALAGLCGPGIALADVYRCWIDVMGRKGAPSLTGNGINHPNDFGHRLYAEEILTLLCNADDEASAGRL